MRSSVVLSLLAFPRNLVHSDEELEEGSTGEGGARGGAMTLAGGGGNAFPDRVASVRRPRAAPGVPPSRAFSWAI